MTIRSPHAEDTCLNNHYRPTYHPNTTDEVSPGGSGDLEKLHNDHDEDEPNFHNEKDEQHEHHRQARRDSIGTTNLSAQTTASTSDRSHESRIPTTLPERVASRMSGSSALTFPEGGLSGWLAVFGSFCAMLSVFGLINSSAVFESYFSEHQLRDYNSSQIGWIFSLYLFVVFFVGIQIGPIFDRHGPRWLVPTGSLFLVLSVMLLGFCTGSFRYWSYIYLRSSLILASSYRVLPNTTDILGFGWYWWCLTQLTSLWDYRPPFQCASRLRNGHC